MKELALKLVSFERSGVLSYGILKADGIVDFRARVGTGGTTLRDQLTDLAAIQKFEREAADFPLAEVALLPPVWNPGRILCVGLNYKSHIAETGRESPAFPMMFPRYPDSLVGSGSSLVRPRVSERFDYEGELAFVIGRPGRHISEKDALDHVAGYACFNDGSIRDFQRHTTQFLPGKNFWRSGSFGPWLVTPDEVGPIEALTLITRLNGTEMRRAKLDDLLFGVPQLIAYLSQIMPLQPGDVIATGTTGGVGAFREPPVWMRPGDKVEISIDRLGTLANSIVDEAAV